MNHINKEKRWVYHLLLHSKDIKGCGLFNGRMGIILALMTCARHYDLKPIEEAMMNVLSQTISSIPDSTPLNFSDGLLGIGWGLEYLNQSHLLHLNTIDSCEAINQKLMQHDVSFINDSSLSYGLSGILTYVLAHIQGNPGQQPFSSAYLNNLHSVTINWTKDNPKEFQVLRQKFCDYMNGKAFKIAMELTPFISENTNNKYDVLDLSLQSGIAGKLLSKIIK